MSHKLRSLYNTFALFLIKNMKNVIHPNEGIRLLHAHAEFKKFADAHGVKVVNCTRGGMLEAYPRMTLEDVLSGRTAS